MLRRRRRCFFVHRRRRHFFFFPFCFATRALVVVPIMTYVVVVDCCWCPVFRSVRNRYGAGGGAAAATATRRTARRIYPERKLNVNAPAVSADLNTAAIPLSAFCFFSASCETAGPAAEDGLARGERLLPYAVTPSLSGEAGKIHDIHAHPRPCCPQSLRCLLLKRSLRTEPWVDCIEGLLDQQPPNQCSKRRTRKRAWIVSLSSSLHPLTRSPLPVLRCASTCAGRQRTQASMRSPHAQAPAQQPTGLNKAQSHLHEVGVADVVLGYGDRGLNVEREVPPAARDEDNLACWCGNGESRLEASESGPYAALGARPLSSRTACPRAHPLGRCTRRAAPPCSRRRSCGTTRRATPATTPSLHPRTR